MRWPWSARTGHESAEPVAGEESRRPRVERPSGALTWLCVSPAGARTAHDTEQAAKNQAAMHVGSVYYPVTIELEESA